MAVNPNSHIIAVTGGKGGVGKSVFSVNLACAFMLEMRKPVLLIDMDAHSCGDQSFLLGIEDARTLSQLCSFNGAITPGSLTSVVTNHKPTGLAYVAAVRNRDETLNVSPEICMRQLEHLSNIFPYIIVDLGSQLQPLQMQLIERATVLLTVAQPEVLAINQTMRLLNELMAASLPNDVVHIVVNKANASGLAPQAIAQALRRNVIGAIPQDDIAANGSIQRSQPFVPANPKAPISAAYFEIVRKLTGGVLQSLRSTARPKTLKAKATAVDSGSGISESIARPGDSANKNLEPKIKLKLTVHEELIKDPELKKFMTSDPQLDKEREMELRRKTQAVVSQLVDREGPGMPRPERALIIKEILDEALGLGPLEDLLADEAVKEIMVNGPAQIYIERDGTGLELTNVRFTSNFHLRNVIERIVRPLGRQINDSSPYVDARLRDGSRVNAVIEPIAIDGHSITIRKFRKRPVNPETYVREWQASTAAMMEFLRVCVQNKLNIVISGGTGSGKTTLLNTLSGFIPSNERIITIEDAAELQLKQTHVVRLETKPPNVEGKGQVTIRDLVRNSLRMRPERIVVGECRDGAALDMLQAMNTGHDGSMTTIHANSPKEAISRLETLCLMSGMDLPAKAIREQIASAVHLIVQISRLSDNTRKIINITEVQGMQGDVVTLMPIYEFREKGFDKNRKILGNFYSTGLVPKFIRDLEAAGHIMPQGLFNNDAEKKSPAPATPQPEIKKASGGSR